jgi:lipopolysaccharide/colanic/teichoic acid biosynthesis glycosyltransferase
MPARLQRLLALVALVVLSPCLAALAAAVRVSSGAPILYRAQRISRGRLFTLYKFRSMEIRREREGAVTISGDPRVTAIGRFLRRTKLDELPQLINVVRGEMVLVGPRPEDPTYIDWSDPDQAVVFMATAGITGLASLTFHDEEEQLVRASVDVAGKDGRVVPTAADVDRAYRSLILPAKVSIEMGYLRNRSTRGDIAVLARTFAMSFKALQAVVPALSRPGQGTSGPRR